MTVIVAMMLIVMMLFSCDKTQREELKAGHADSLIFAAGAVMQYDRLLTLVDSFDATGLTPTAPATYSISLQARYTSSPKWPTKSAER